MGKVRPYNVFLGINTSGLVKTKNIARNWGFILFQIKSIASKTTYNLGIGELKYTIKCAFEALVPKFMKY